MSTVFISYRRENSSGEARALFNDLAARLGNSSVFMDVDSIALGRDFRSVLQKTLESCDLMLVVIDKHWLEAKDAEGRTRLKNPKDYVRMEIEAALKRDIAVTPVLVQGASMPSEEQLPAEIGEFAYRNAFELSSNRWNSDTAEMVRRLRLVPSERKEEIATGHGSDSDRPQAAPSKSPIANRHRVWIVGTIAAIAALSALLLFADPRWFRQEGECQFAGSWRWKQANGPLVSVALEQDRNGALMGTASYLGNSGVAKGQVSGRTVRLEIAWKNGTAGIYEGDLDMGKLSGTTWAKDNSNINDTWESQGTTFRCYTAWQKAILESLHVI